MKLPSPSSMRYLLPLVLSLLGLACSYAVEPNWWSKDATRIVDGEAEDADNYVPANTGQLKHVALKAFYHLEIGLYLHGGANSELKALVGNFEPKRGETYTGGELEAIAEANFAPANLGQLKAVAKLFYDRLLDEGYDTKSNLIARGFPGTWEENYPWDPETPVEENYSPANLGQLKVTFSFSLENPFAGTDTDGDGLADAWETAHGFDPNDWDENNNGIPDGLDDADSDGMVNLGEQLQGRDPNTGVDSDESGELALRVYTRLEN